jgi:protein-tyrosine phosphatase
MAQLVAIPLDISPIAPPLLFQGSRPPRGPALRAAGIHVVVLCDNEYQPRGPEFEGVHVIHAPMLDELAPVSEENWQRARNASRIASRFMREHGACVLTTCRMGWNRSGFVNALILMRTIGMSGREAVRIVRERRQGALQNPYFARFVAQMLPTGEAWPPQPRRRARR